MSIWACTFSLLLFLKDDTKFPQDLHVRNVSSGAVWMENPHAERMDN